MKNIQGIEGIPAGYRMVAYRKPVNGDIVAMNDGSTHEWGGSIIATASFPILEKIDTGRPMSEFPMDKYSNVPGTENCLFFVDGEWIEGYGIPPSASKFMAYGPGEEVQPLGWKPKDE